MKTLRVMKVWVAAFFLLIPSVRAAEESLFTPAVADSVLVRRLFAYIEENRDSIISEWIRLTEIPAPSGHEAERAKYLREQFEAAGLDSAEIDAAGNVVGLWKGTEGGKTVVMPAHMDTVFQGVWEIKVERSGNVLKAPGIGDDTAGLINLLWVLRALKQAGFKPKPTYCFLGTVSEEVGFVGMRAFMDTTEEDVDLVLALDGDLGGVHYGALGFGGGRVVYRGPGAHTMQSRGVPNPNLAVAKAIQRLSQIPLPAEPLTRWTILNIGMMEGGKVRNAVPQESSLTIDLRSASQEELERAQGEIRSICQAVAAECGVEAEISLNEDSKASQVQGAGDSFLVNTVVDILHFLGVEGVRADPLGSTDANVGIERGILSLNLGRTFGRYKHTLREEADIDGLFLAVKQVLLVICSLNNLD